MTVRLKWSCCSAQLIDEQGKRTIHILARHLLKKFGSASVVCYARLSCGVADDISKHYRSKIGGFLRLLFIIKTMCCSKLKFGVNFSNLKQKFLLFKMIFELKLKSRA